MTSDHGIRTRAEDPALPVGTISDYMFRVPLVVYAPQTLDHTSIVSSPTSHVDLAPTIATLFGKTESAQHMQGIPIWQRTPRDRIYLLASAYGGADGFVEDGAYYMRQSLSGAVYRNSALAFAEEHQVLVQPQIARVVNVLKGAADLQHALVSLKLQPMEH
jgi:arylsulfatase A-like enzyme